MLQSKSQSGLALLTSVIVVSFMLLTSFTLATIFIKEMKGTSAYEDSIKALQFANSGIELALKDLKSDLCNSTSSPNPNIGFTCDNQVATGGEGHWDGLYSWDNLSNDSVNSSRPQLEIDTFGNIHVVWQTSVSIGNYDIYYAKWSKSDDRWTIFTNVSNNTGDSQNPDIEIDSNGIPHVVWYDTSVTKQDIFYSKWDGSSSWIKADGTPGSDNLSHTAYSAYSPKINLDSNNNPHVVWNDNDTGNHEVYYAQLNGTTWNKYNISQSASWGSWYPEIKLFGNNLHIVWNEDLFSGNREVFYTNLDVTNVNWESPTNISNASGYSYSIQIQLDSQGNPHVVWEDNKTGIYEVYYAKKENFVWTNPPVNISRSPNDYSGAAKIDIDVQNNIHVVWTDDITGNSDIFYSKFDNISWSSPNNVSNTPAADSDSHQFVLSGSTPHIVWKDYESNIYYSKWDGSNWVKADGNFGHDNLSRNMGLSGSPQIRIAGDKPHVVWNSIITGSYDAYYTRWDGTDWGGYLGDNLSNSSVHSEYPQIQLDSDGNPYIAWVEDSRSSTSSVINFVRWNPSVNGGRGGWESLSGVSGDTSNIGEFSFVIRESDNTPFLVWTGKPRGNIDLLFSRWDQATNSWVKMDGAVGYDNLCPENGTSFNPQIKLDSAGNPYVVWVDDSFTNSNREVLFSRWNSATSKWTKMDGTIFGKNKDYGYDNLSNNSSGHSDNPQIELFGNNPYIVWQDSSPYYLYYSEWNGSSWIKTNISKNSSGIPDIPQIKLNTDGSQLHVVYRFWGGGVDDIYYTQGLGTTWPDPINISNINNASPGPSSYPRLQLDSSGNPHVVWIDQSPGNWDIYYSTIVGGNWPTPTNISSTSEDSIRPQIQLSGDTPHVVWYEGSSSAGYEIFYSKWNGSSWVGLNTADGITRYDNLSNNSGWSMWPLIRLSGDTPHVVWHDNSSGNYEIFYLKWHPGTGGGGLGNEYTITATGTYSNIKRKIEMKVRKNIDDTITILSRKEVAPD